MRYALKQQGVLPASAAAPTCQTCHMPDGDHAVHTAWGFLAVRLPLPEDPQWKADQVTILQALGVLDPGGSPTKRLDVVKAAADRIAPTHDDDGATTTRQPITTQPYVFKHPTQPGFIVIIGTGSYITETDGVSTEIQSVYGIWDRGEVSPATANANAKSTRLVRQTVTNVVNETGTAIWRAGLDLVGLCTVVWVLAFNGVYRQEHPWLQASRWIYTYVPADSKLLAEGFSYFGSLWCTADSG